MIPLDRIKIEDQPRTEFDEATIKELAQDIEQHGLLQPVLVNQISVTHPNLGFRSRQLLEDCVCEDIELLSTFSQMEEMNYHKKTNEAEKLIRTGNMNRQQARDFLKKIKEDIADDDKKRKKKAEEREAKAKQPPKFDPGYEMRYGIHEMVTDEEIPLETCP